MGRRVLVTGLGTFWGGRIAQRIERDPRVDMVVGLGTTAPTVALERTEYVHSDPSYTILSRIVAATRVDTVVHTSLLVDGTGAGNRVHEVNVIGTLNLLAAASQPDSPVATMVVKSATAVYGAHHRDPVWFGEDTPRSANPRYRVERSLVEVESLVRDYALDNPHVSLTILRFADVIGADIVTPVTAALQRPVVPAIAGFDPRLQVVHEDDVVRALLFVLDRGLGGVYNVAGDGLLTWSEIAALCGRPRFPLPPLARHLLPRALARLHVDLPAELGDLLTYGRGVDNRRLKEAGFTYHHSSASTVRAFAEAMRLRHAVGPPTPYHYDSEVEAFFHRSPAVMRD